MSIRDRFCPVCGRLTESDGLCTTCRTEDAPWFTCDHRVHGVFCPGCGATRQAKTWTDSADGRSGLAQEVARAAVHFHTDVRRPSVTVQVTDVSPNRSKADITVRGTVHGTPQEGACSTEIVWKKEQCDRCNRISGSYYEGIVQVRAEGRTPGIYELQMASGIAQQVEDTLQAGGERLSYIAEMEETSEGLDITVGSQHIGALISQAIIAQLGGRSSTHPKLIGEKNGRQLFRITWSIRLPRFQKQDIIRSRGRYFQVFRAESARVRVLDLKDGTQRTVRGEEVDRIVGNLRDAVPAQVVYVERNTLGILDPDTCQTQELEKVPWLDADAGGQVMVLHDNGTLVMVG